MREDMSKVVIERPRWGHSLPSSKTRLRINRYDPDKEYDDLPKRVSGSRSKYILAGETKYFSDLLGPLRRFLRKNVGRPWDQVYSEMKESIDDRKVTGRHVFEHVDMDVEPHALIGEDGELYKLGYGGRLQPVYGFYVDPRTGLLCCRDNAQPWRPRGQSKGAGQVRVRLSANTGYFKMNGIWYFIEYKVAGESVNCDQAKQAALLSNMPKVSALPKMIVRKKQLSHKELKAANLRNDHPPAGNGDMSRR